VDTIGTNSHMLSLIESISLHKRPTSPRTRCRDRQARHCQAILRLLTHSSGSPHLSLNSSLPSRFPHYFITARHRPEQSPRSHSLTKSPNLQSPSPTESLSPTTSPESMVPTASECVVVFMYQQNHRVHGSTKHKINSGNIAIAETMR
jgi:hypothetical protein